MRALVSPFPSSSLAMMAPVVAFWRMRNASTLAIIEMRTGVASVSVSTNLSAKLPSARRQSVLVMLPDTVCPMSIGVVASQRADTGTVTATIAAPVAPSAATEMLALPAVTPVTSPAALTVAMAGVSDDQV